MRIPGFTGATGGETRASEAEMPSDGGVSTLGEWEIGGASSLDSPLIVEVEEDRKDWVRGARWVSFNFLVSFHDILVIEGADVLLWGRMKRTQDEEDNNRVQCDPSRQKARLRRVSNAMNANGQSAGHPSRHNWC